VRLLHTRWSADRDTVDRTLDVAISQFAPGSQTVRDKAVHTAVGVVELRKFGDHTFAREGFSPPLMVPNPLLLGLCDRCQAVVEQQRLTTFADDGDDESAAPNVACPVCGATDMHVVDAREPKAFLTDLSPEDFEGQFEWTPRASRPSMRFNSEGEQPEHVGNVTLRTLNDDIISVNDNGGKGGFDFRAARVYDRPQSGAYASLDTPEDTADDVGPSTDNVSVYGRSWRVALLSRRRTDALLVSMTRWSVGTFADPTTVEGRAAWYSLAFFLRLAAGERLDVDALELEAGFRSRELGGRPGGEAFLCDVLENGAGYSRRLADPSEFRELLKKADPAGAGSIAMKWTAMIPASDAPVPHASECDTSCNRCLRDFQNLPYHGLLDWRLALDMARLADSQDAILDLDSPWHGSANPWLKLVDGPDSLVSKTLARLGYGPPQQFDSLTGYVHARHGRVLIVRHPLWEDDHPRWQPAEWSARAANPAADIRPVNPFRVLRRPADCL